MDTDSKNRTTIVLGLFNDYALSDVYDSYLKVDDAEFETLTFFLTFTWQWPSLIHLTRSCSTLYNVFVNSGGYTSLQAISIAESGVTAVVGEFYSVTAAFSAQIFSHYEIPFCSSTASSPELSDKHRFKYIFRTTTGSGYGNNIVALLKHWSVRRLALVLGDDRLSKAGGMDVENALRESGISLLTKMKKFLPPFLSPRLRGMELARAMDWNYRRRYPPENFREDVGVYDCVKLLLRGMHQAWDGEIDSNSSNNGASIVSVKLKKLIGLSKSRNGGSLFELAPAPSVHLLGNMDDAHVVGACLGESSVSFTKGQIWSKWRIAQIAMIENNAKTWLVFDFIDAFSLSVTVDEVFHIVEVTSLAVIILRNDLKLQLEFEGPVDPEEFVKAVAKCNRNRWVSHRVR
ncbi:hypothetical protein HDU76_003629 [Blyttiomyces sp. JEL0837]|nr:hypothetical protein HDU76_003629 [Blyttiomyces sp. JEL0837]